MASYAQAGDLAIDAPQPDFYVCAEGSTRKEAFDRALAHCRSLESWPLVLEPLRIDGVAILLDGGDCMIRLPAPARHHNLLRLAAEMRVDGVHTGVQGFYTSRGEFVTREAAVEIASDAGQIIRKTAPETHLFSEDIW